MKRILLITLAATALISSCNQDEVVDRNPQGAISFDNAFVDTQMRSGELNTGNLTQFYVSGVIQTTGKREFGKVFDNQLVEKKANTGTTDWTYTPPKFWFEGDYNFIAFSHKDNSKAVAALPENLADFKTGYKIVFNNGAYAGQEDLIFAKAEVLSATEVYNQPVNLTFGHALSRAKFSFRNEMGNDLYTLKIKDISTNKFYAQGEFTFQTETWGATAGEFSPAYAITPDEAAADNATISTNIIYLIPQQATSITFTVDIYNDGKLVKTKTFTSTLTTQMLKGTSYNFTAVIDETALKLNQIEFQAGVETWGSDSDVAVTIPQQ